MSSRTIARSSTGTNTSRPQDYSLLKKDVKRFLVVAVISQIVFWFYPNLNPFKTWSSSFVTATPLPSGTQIPGAAQVGIASGYVVGNVWHDFEGLLYTDPTTGVMFELIDGRTNKSGNVFETYLKNIEIAAESTYSNSSTISRLEKRNLLDCVYPNSPVRQQICSTAHATAASVLGIGVAAVTSTITTTITNAFSNGRGGQSPRSICHVIDDANLCISWANYDSQKLKNGESADIAGYATKCIQAGYSSEYQGSDVNGGAVFICQSGRASGCGASVNGCDKSKCKQTCA